MIRFLPNLHPRSPMNVRPFLPMLGLLFAATALAQPSAEEIVRKSIAYHDPAGVWMTRAHHLTLIETRPGGKDRKTSLVLDYPTGGFSYRSEREGRVVEAAWDGTECSATLDGSADIPDDLRERYRLSCDGVQWWHAYYGYMHSLPMNLADPGVRLDPDVRTTTFAGRKAYAVRVTYDEPGSDTWYFYFDPATYAIIGSRFYHDESANDGEYIVFEGEAAHDGIRLPKTLKWYVNADDRYLGADIIEAYTHAQP